MRTCASKLLPALAALGVLLAPAASARAHGLLVFAAASLKESLTEAADAFVASGNPKPVLSFAASSALARQIENGAPAGLFVSADEQWMDYLSGRGFIVAGTRTTLLGNELVLVAPAERPFDIDIRNGFALSEVLREEKLAMADPDSVPAGRYGKEALTNLGVWAGVEGNVARTADVRGALALVERNEARAGIVYRTDAMATKKVVIAGTFPAASHRAIGYPLGIVREHDTPGARALRNFLLSPEAKRIFESHGFRILAGSSVAERVHPE